MRLLNFYVSGEDVHLGVVHGKQVVDLTAALGDRPEFVSLSAWLRAGKPARRVVEELLAGGLSSGADTVALEALRYAPLVSRESRIFCVGLNYADHATENNLPPPSSPIFLQSCHRSSFHTAPPSRYRLRATRSTMKPRWLWCWVTERTAWASQRRRNVSRDTRL